ncbi:transposase [Methyloglobulus sp.]|uniref:transposase n=1 Tax=Methyloglobulus sp. TaxID=2518622 RepID=UPI0039891108
MSPQSKQKRPEYTLEFKQDAAKLVNERGYPHQQAADRLGIPLSVVGRWVGAERGPASTATTQKAVLNLTGRTGLLRLGKENARLRMGRETTKKAAVFFAKEIE